MNFHITEKKKHLFLLSLLLLLTIVVRLQNDYQTDFDSYWLSAEAESIQLEGSALWVYHPASLFGYYPLSYPSGVMFFMASLSTLTGLSMIITAKLFGLFNAIMIVFLITLVGRKFFKSWLVGYLAGLIAAVSPLLMHYTDFNASGRAFVMIFYLFFLWTVLHYEETRKKRFLCISILMLLFALLSHRTSQLILVFIVAVILAAAYRKLPIWYEYLRKNKHFHKFFHTRYQQNRYALLLDVGVVFVLLVAVKAVDLITRGRFLPNIQSRLVNPILDMSTHVQDYYLYAAIALGAIILIFVVLWIILKRNPLKAGTSWAHHHYHRAFEEPEFYLSIALLLIALYFFVEQFFGGTFYAPSLNDYYSSDLFSGSQPWIIAINFLINYSTAVTTLFVFYFVGFLAMLLRKRKTFGEWVFVLSFVAFSSVMLDKNYVRAFLIPFISLVTAYGIVHLYLLLNMFIKKKKIRSILTFLLTFLVTILIILGLFMPAMRSTVFGETRGFENQEYYWDTGQYIRSLDCDCSTVTTREQVAGVTIFMSSGVPGGSHNVYYYVDKDNLQFEYLGLGHAWDSIMNGDKLENLWLLPDWIFGSEYYVGRHTRYLFDRPFYDGTVQRIINDYNEQYYIHDEVEEKNTFIQSIDDISNVVYVNPLTTVYDLEKGRQEVNK